MTVDWRALASHVGGITAQGERGGTHVARLALEALLGEDTIRGAVQHAVSGAPGAELAMSVLAHVRSLRATEIAYALYRSGSVEAVWLIKHIAHPRALAWVEEFLADDAAAGWGIDVLDQLLWRDPVDRDDPEALRLLGLAERHPAEQVRERAAFIRRFLADEHGTADGDPPPTA
jgi:hypothetical protein